ncbi:MaoC family dehydratase [Mycolicibacterium sp. CH28]|uniref:MaoC family dehydratase n=1 Tax=Mycolicibacterium sp. CH28 TaxID=2512237 RepID=UPI001080759B|nr:MaoC family dehydratase [Mycolicibacterium sp. CH28]TGD85923.1 MaoC family dehydratase [Mycolicibacterium sp. CH28]
MRIFASRAQVEAAVGEDLGTSGWVQVTQPMIDSFADVTRDHQWIHVDRTRAEAGPYGATIAHGYLTLSLLPAFRQQIYDIPEARAQLNYGLNKVRFPGIVPVDSRLRGRARLADVVDRGEAVDVIVEYTVERDGADKPVCIAESVVRVLF